MDSADRLSFEELFAHAAGVRALAAALASDRAEADDLVQDTWIAAWRHPPAADTPPAAWLARVVRNLARNRWRASGRRGERERLAARPEGAPGADEVALELEMHRALVDALASLAEPHRTTVVRRFLHGVSAADLAREAGIPESTVRNRSKRALEALRESLDRRFGDRKTWGAALAPLLAPRAATSSTWIGGTLAMSATWKLALAILVLGGVALWIVPRSRGTSDVDPPVLGGSAVEALEGERDASEAGPAVVAASSEGAAMREAIAAGSKPTEIDAASGTAPAVLEALLVDPAGLPIAGAEAWVCARADLGEIAEDEAPRAASDAQGRVRLEVRPSDQSPHQGRNGALPEDQWTLEIAFGGPRQETRRESFLFTAGAATAVGTIALRPGGELLGRLVLPGGTIPPRSFVDVIPPDLSLAEQESGRFHGLARQRVAWGRLDEAGAYRIRGVPAGTYRVATTGEVPGWFHAWSEPFELRAGETVTVPDLVLAPNPNVITGRVLASDGGRPKGVDLRYADADSSGTAERPWLSGSVGRDGAFEIAFETPGAHDLYFCGPPDQARGELLVRGVVTGTRDLELRLGEPASMELAVQGEDGGRLADFGYAVHWVGMEGFGSSLSFTNHPTGRLRIPVRALPFVLRVTGSDHLPEDVGPFDTMHHPEEIVVRLRSMPSLSARVLFEGRPIEGASVSLQSIAPPGRLQACNGFPCRFEDYASPRRTDADGRCTIRAGDPGRRALLVRAEGYAEAETEAFDFDPNATGAEHAIELARGGSLEGRVLPRGGSSAEGILVGISRGDGVCRIVRVAADGRYRFERLAAGTWWLRRCPRDYVAEGGYSYEVVEGFDPSLAETRVEDGRTTSFDLDLRDAFAVVEGRLAIEPGAAAAWTVRLVEPGENPQGQDGGRLDAGGQFRFDAERLGPHTLVFRLVADDRDQEIEVPLAIERGVRRVDVAVATGTIEGTARPGASIEHVWLGSPPTRGLAHWGADASGRFRVEGVPAGRGTLSIVEHGTRSAAVAVDVPDGGTVRVELR